MITRDLSNIQYVHAFNNKSTGVALTPFNLFTVAGQVCTCGGVLSTGIVDAGFGGPMIDRLGLLQNYSAVVPVVSAWGAVTASATTCQLAYMAISVGIQHSSSTCSGGFSDYSTGQWMIKHPLQHVSTATTTADAFYNSEATLVSGGANQRLMTTGQTTSTSTGYAYFVSGQVQPFSLEGAKRFLRMVVAPHIENDGCAASYMHAVGALVFGDPDAGPASTAPTRARVHIASSAGACTT